MKEKHERLSNVCLCLMFLRNSWVCFSDLQPRNWEGQPGLASSTRRGNFHALDQRHRGGDFIAHRYCECLFRALK